MGEPRIILCERFIEEDVTLPWPFPFLAVTRDKRFLPARWFKGMEEMSTINRSHDLPGG